MDIELRVWGCPLEACANLSDSVIISCVRGPILETEFRVLISAFRAQGLERVCFSCVPFSDFHLYHGSRGRISPRVPRRRREHSPSPGTSKEDQHSNVSCNVSRIALYSRLGMMRRTARKIEHSKS